MEKIERVNKDSKFIEYMSDEENQRKRINMMMKEETEDEMKQKSKEVEKIILEKNRLEKFITIPKQLLTSCFLKGERTIIIDNKTISLQNKEKMIK